MDNKSYSFDIEIPASPAHVFNCINNVPGWFRDKGFGGSSTQLNDEFVFHYGKGDDAHYSKQRVVEFIPDKKVTWLITESKINWIENDKEEWTGTKVIFELSGEGDKTTLYFTHQGLTPELECYPDVVLGWKMIVGEWLVGFIKDAKAL